MSRRYHLHLPRRGPVAQLGARLNGIQKVRGSNPLGSTKFLNSDLAPVLHVSHWLALTPYPTPHCPFIAAHTCASRCGSLPLCFDLIDRAGVSCCALTRRPRLVCPESW